MKIYTCPPNSGTLELGRTLPSLLDEAVERCPNPKAFNQRLPGGGWRHVSNAAFRELTDEAAAGLLAIGLQRGEKVCFLMASDLHFQVADMACLTAGLIDVPLYTNYAPDNLRFVIEHAEAHAVIVSNLELLEQLRTVLPLVPELKTVIMASPDDGTPAESYRRDARAIVGEAVELLLMDDVRARGRDALAADPNMPARLRAEIDAEDLATILYTSGTTGTPKGVMLTHQNISSNVMAAFSGLEGLGRCETETALTFLPMTHVFARVISYGHINYGHEIYYSDPLTLVDDLADVKPTIFAAVPRVLEKVYDKVLLGIEQAEGLKKSIGKWAVGLAQRYEIGTEPSGLDAFQMKLADKLVFSKIREKLGGRVDFVVVGGAALRPDIANFFTAAGVQVLQGYGLSETSPVITFNRPEMNRAGTVGPPVAGVEVAIAEDGEILSRGPNTMKGYYKDAEKTAEVIDADGWFHTGDIGEFSADGYLRITDRKKDLFKLSTGKYVMPTPVESAMMKDPLVEQAVVVGAGEKYCTALVFPNEEAVAIWAAEHAPEAVGKPLAEQIKHPKVIKEFERLVHRANDGMEHWSQVKRFRIVPSLMTIENELLTPTMKVKRSKVHKAYETELRALYDTPAAEGREVEAVV